MQAPASNGLDELTSSARGDGYDQSWTLDGLGNWSGYNNDGSSQTRTANAANEITATSGIGTPAYDRAGNMTVIPSPTSGNPSHTLAAKYLEATAQYLEMYRSLIKPAQS